MCGRNWPHKQAASCSYQEYIHRPKSMSVREQLQSMAYQEVRYFADGLAWLACVFMQKLLDYSSQAIGRRQAAIRGGVMEDKLIDFIVFPTQELIRSGPDGQLSFHEQNLGDHGELWVLKIKDGVEISRFNAQIYRNYCVGRAIRAGSSPRRQAAMSARTFIGNQRVENGNLYGLWRRHLSCNRLKLLVFRALALLPNTVLRHCVECL